MVSVHMLPKIVFIPILCISLKNLRSNVFSYRVRPAARPSSRITMMILFFKFRISVKPQHFTYINIPILNSLMDHHKIVVSCNESKQCTFQVHQIYSLPFILSMAWCKTADWTYCSFALCYRCDFQKVFTLLSATSVFFSHTVPHRASHTGTRLSSGSVKTAQVSTVYIVYITVLDISRLHVGPHFCHPKARYYSQNCGNSLDPIRGRQPVKCEMKLLIHSQTPMASLLKLGNR